MNLAEARQAARKAARAADDARRAVADAEAAEQARLESLGMGEPSGEPSDYQYAALHLGNGAQVMAQRSPNGVWWWEDCMCNANERCRRWGDWSQLIECVKPTRVDRLVVAE